MPRRDRRWIFSLTAPTVNDAAHFLNHLRLLFYSMHTFYKIPDARELTDAFQQGYVIDGAMKLPPLPLAWERLRNALHLFLRHHEWSRPPRMWVAALALRHLVKDLTRTLSCAIADQGQRSCRKSPSEREPA